LTITHRLGLVFFIHFLKAYNAMKTLAIAALMLGLTSVGASANAFANPRNKEQSKAKPVATVEQQLANHLTYPEALQQAKGNGVVVIQFKLNQNDRITDLTVHSANEGLNAELANQLRNVKLTPVKTTSPEQVYTAQLRFKAGE
jgi:hypothetical protein